MPRISTKRMTGSGKYTPFDLDENPQRVPHSATYVPKGKINTQLHANELSPIHGSSQTPCWSKFSSPVDGWPHCGIVTDELRALLFPGIYIHQDGRGVIVTLIHIFMGPPAGGTIKRTTHRTVWRS